MEAETSATNLRGAADKELKSPPIRIVPVDETSSVRTKALGLGSQLVGRADTGLTAAVKFLAEAPLFTVVKSPEM